MSFKCTYCNEPQPTGTSQNRVVVETRNVTYPRTEDGQVPTGTEIVKEVNLCAKCKNVT